LKALNQDFPQYAHLCVAVEQTDRGIQVVEALEKQGMPLLCPLVNSARSVTKKQIVAPMIGESVVFHAEHELHSVNPKLRIEPKVATIIGYGSVGKATADALRLRGYTIHVYDVDPTKMEQARRDGCTATTREDALRNAHSLYSCTGVTAVTREDYALLPDHAVLVNAASGNHELDLHDLPPSFFSDHDADLQVDGDQRASSSFKGERAALGDLGGGEAMLNRVLRVNGKELLVVRSGYVVNMTLGLPPEYVQLELSMLLASCLQAVNETEPGLVDVDPNTQKLLQSRARTHLKRIGHALEQPDFRSLPIWQLA
jgi:S-adenosylhomocysteine hydrolase